MSSPLVTSPRPEDGYSRRRARAQSREVHPRLPANLSPREVAEMPDDEFETHSTLPEGGQVTLDLAPLPRAVMPLRTAQEARNKAIEFAAGFTEEQARAEGSRCLRCDLAYLCPVFTSKGAPVQSAIKASSAVLDPAR